ncbi:Response regulator receiver protein [Hyella patelloides LEGE 07179]|uniref:Response regulator receiver protein n=1 Tax=Hyella patelloides LEGE 07179 TaxID=945734 RepID=A0A563VM97_9CYAN|nr:response regulator [Hyella patelloides]VEP12584.1 Response regulator receiver protein [Hyella patelloides LEGE 07179]
MDIKNYRQRIQAKDSNVPIVLVVEDEEDNLLYISHALILLKHNFITATKGQTALDLATEYEIDLVILDLVLPDIHGLEVVSLLKQNELTQNMPIIAVSGMTRQQDRDRAMNAGCDDYLDKPYFIDELDRKVKQYLPKSSFNKNFQGMMSNVFDLLKFHPKLQGFSV